MQLDDIDFRCAYMDRWLEHYVSPLANLTKKQYKLLKFFYDYNCKFGRYPNMREIIYMLDTSQSSANHFVIDLKNAEKIISETSLGKRKTLRLTDSAIAILQNAIAPPQQKEKLSEVELIGSIQNLKTRAAGVKYPNRRDIIKSLQDLELVIWLGEKKEEYNGDI